MSDNKKINNNINNNINNINNIDNKPKYNEPGYGKGYGYVMTNNKYGYGNGYGYVSNEASE